MQITRVDAGPCRGLPPMERIGLDCDGVGGCRAATMLAATGNRGMRRRMGRLATADACALSCPKTDIAGPDSKIVALKAGLRPGAQIQGGGIVSVVAGLKLFG